MSSLETPNLNNAPSIGNIDRPELSLPSIRRGAPLPAKQEPATVKRQKQVAQILNSSLEAHGQHRPNVKGILVNRKIRPSPSQLVVQARKNVIEAGSIGSLTRKRNGRNMVVNASTNDANSLERDGLAEDSIHS